MGGEERNLPLYIALKERTAPRKHLAVEGVKLTFAAAAVLDERAKWAIEFNGTGEAHIRSCYNNKYWVRLESEDGIGAAADEPVEDRSARNCTLFNANVTSDGPDGPLIVWFVHVQSQKWVKRESDSSPYLVLAPKVTGPVPDFAVVDYGSLIKLPKYLTFRGKSVNKTIVHGSWLTFIDDEKVGDAPNYFEVLYNNDGNIYIGTRVPNNNNLLNVWALFQEGTSPLVSGAILANTTFDDKLNNNPTDPKMLFSLIKIEGSVFALRHLYNNLFLKQVDLYAGLWGLASQASNLTLLTTQLELSEPVLRREINIHEFHIDRARIYDRIPLTLAESGGRNDSDREQSLALQFSYNKTKTMSWDTTTSWFLNASVTLTTKIPFISEMAIEIGGGYSEEYNWGETLSESETVTATYTVVVPPRTKATVAAVATQGTCDVPYSYLQIDLLLNGETRKTELSDGIFKGVNSYHFDFSVNYEPILSNPLPEDGTNTKLPSEFQEGLLLQE